MNQTRTFLLLSALLGTLLTAGCPEPTPNPPGNPCADGGAGCEEPVKCDADTPCEDGLVCDEETSTCVAPCPLGTVSCPCDDGACNEGLECSDEGTCQLVDCPVGTLGCGCRPNLTCAPGEDGEFLRCDPSDRTCRAVVDDSESPGVPQADCFTPCTDSLTLPDGTFRYCSPEGLMEGCVGELQCVDGSCVGEGEGPRTCSAAVDCPNHQTCIEGLCLSNCSVNSDCGPDSACHEAVCRDTCKSDVAGSCQPGFTCHTSDGLDGVCLPTVVEDVPDPTAPEVPFTVSVDSLQLTNNRVSGVFEITNASDRAREFTIRKLEHVVTTDDGLLVETEMPLFWLHIGPAGEEEQQQEFEIEILPGEKVSIGIANAFNSEIDRWSGRIEVRQPDLGVHEISLDYATKPDGQWSGSIHYFINFDDRRVAEWQAALGTPSAVTAARTTQNALLSKWTSFRSDPFFTLREWNAVVNSTLTGSWDFATMKQACEEVWGADKICYPYTDGSQGDSGLRVYTDQADLRVPSGVIEMPLTVRLQKDPAGAFRYTGRIETPEALQYPGLPPLELEFADDPEACEDPNAAACLAPVSRFSSTILVGGRYLLEGEAGDCAAPFAKHTVPWLVPNFTAGTRRLEDGSYIREECRENRFPFDAGGTSLAAKLNASLAGGNPIPDGRVRVRQLELLDGVMVNQDTIFLIVRETFQANLAENNENADFAAYAIVRLSRSGGNIDDDGFTPGVVPDSMSLVEPDDKLQTGCSEEILDELLGEGTPLEGNENQLADILLYGRDRAFTPTPLQGAALNNVHYLCHATGRFDGGRTAWGAEGGEACPLGSGVTFFHYTGPMTPSDFKDHSCQGSVSDRCLANEDCPAEKRGTCGQALAGLLENDVDDDAMTLTVDLPYACADPDNPTEPSYEATVCSENRLDLKSGKLFYDPAAFSGQPVLEPLRTFIDKAFRYKTRFRSRTGKTIGFVPAVCELSSDQLPYCYDPQAIEMARARTECLLHLFTTEAISDDEAVAGVPSNPNRKADVREFLQGAFSFYQDPVTFEVFDGFERLYSELLVMLGDEALTKAVASRFDLAGSSIAAFDGDKLEPNGIVLSGGAGHEMLQLYRAQQYFQLVLDRFYRMSPRLWQGLEANSEINVVGLDSIATYFNRLIQASTKKARVASEISKRYQAFNRPDLSRHVVERSYTEAYLESVALSQFMRGSISVVQPNEVEAVRFELIKAQRLYSQSLRQMREAYQDITDEVTFFGDPPDYVPFPAPGRFDLPSPRLMLDRAFESLQIAKERETRALESNRAFDTDAAQFQAELARIRQQYESELGDLCGTLVASDNQVFPATRKYAALFPTFAAMGDPCGLVGNGDIWDAMANIESAKLNLRREMSNIRAIFARAQNEQERADAECAARVDIASMQFEAAGEVITIQQQIQAAQRAINDWERELSELDRIAGMASSWGQVASAAQASISGCDTLSVGICVAQAVAGGVAVGAFTAAAVTQSIALDTQLKANEDIATKEEAIHGLENDIADLERTTEYTAALMECCLDDTAGSGPSGSGCDNPGPLLINSEARIDDILVDLMTAQVEALRADVELRRAIGAFGTLRNRAVRLIAQQEETEQHLINVEAARNDPNIRIYANADVLDADKAFNDARTDAYRATRMFEYYTATSYAAKEDLFLVRMAGRGDNNLEDYLLDLQRAFNDFEQDYGTPDLRVAVVSLRDDIFQIPEVDGDGRALTPTERTELLRERLTDVKLLDDRGYIRVPFSTRIQQASPLTAIHKLAFVEAEIHGSDVGDRVGRLYLTTRGTATLRSLEEELLYYRMTPVTAVVNPYFNGVRVFDTAVYENRRLKDRPFVNSLWELGLNLRDEEANRDINVDSITDIRLYFYYEDFTLL